MEKIGEFIIIFSYKFHRWGDARRGSGIIWLQMSKAIFDVAILLHEEALGMMSTSS